MALLTLKVAGQYLAEIQLSEGANKSKYCHKYSC